MHSPFHNHPYVAHRHWYLSRDPHRIVHLSNTLSLRSAFSGTPHTRHIFIASSAGQIVNTIVPSGLRQLCPTGPVCAGTLTTRLRLGYECTVSEFVSGVFTDTGRSLSRLRRRLVPGISEDSVADEDEARFGHDSLAPPRGSHDMPWVERISLQCGDQRREVTEVLSGMMCVGGAVPMVLLMFHMRTFPSGYIVPVASRSGFHGHHANACVRSDSRVSTCVNPVAGATNLDRRMVLHLAAPPIGDRERLARTRVPYLHDACLVTAR